MIYFDQNEFQKRRKISLKSFLKGAASILNLFPEPIPLPESKPDVASIADDWRTVGDYLRMFITEDKYGR